MVNALFRFISNSFKLIVMVVIVIGVIYIGMTIFANCRGEPEQINLPDIGKGPYELTIENTGARLFTDEYDTNGSEIMLKSYWQLVDNEYKYFDTELTLDKSIFGEITIRSR